LKKAKTGSRQRLKMNPRLSGADKLCQGLQIRRKNEGKARKTAAKRVQNQTIYDILES
jgi:hypothetical protein